MKVRVDLAHAIRFNAEKGWEIAMDVREFLENRGCIDRETLLSYLGQWVAFSNDGTRILAGAKSLELLEATLAEQQIDAQAVFFEFIPGSEDDMHFSPETMGEVPLPN